MEELRSTDILDREIEADAKKKAGEIIKRAQEECDEILAGVQTRVKTALDQKSAFYDAKIAQCKKNAAAYVPLEKERFLAAFYYEKINFALNEYFDSIGIQGRVALLKDKLKTYEEIILKNQFSVKFFGFSENDANEAVSSYKKNMLSFKEINFALSGEEVSFGNKIHEGLILEAKDLSVKIRLTIDEFVRELKDLYSYELGVALFDGRFPS